MSFETKQVKIGSLYIGGGNPVAVQSMTDISVTDIERTNAEIKRLADAGCDLVRVAVPDKQSAAALSNVVSKSSLPVIADVHYDYKLAVASVENGAAKVRINPGNTSFENMKYVADAAKAHGAAIRIGVNGGSADKTLLAEYNGDKITALTASLEKYVSLFEKFGFYDLVLSAKSSNVKETIALNRAIFAKFPYPLHIGVTEAGIKETGFVKNAIGIGALLADGIGDTVRVSLTGDPVEEVKAAKSILGALGLLHGVTFVSCPKCGRCKINLEYLAKEVFNKVKDINKPLKIAVMGCEVNGVGECSDADLGIAGGNGKIALFSHGKVIETVGADQALAAFEKQLELILK